MYYPGLYSDINLLVLTIDAVLLLALQSSPTKRGRSPSKGDDYQVVDEWRSTDDG